MNIKNLRLKNKYSQSQVANFINISQSNYSKYERNELKPDSETLIKLADLYDVSLDFLLNRTWCNQIGYIPEDKKELVKQIIELETNDAKEVQAFINGLKAGKTQNPNFKVFN